MIKSVNSYAVSALFNVEANVVYAIPRYQREYIWGKPQWENLFDDVEENDFGYFLGSIICINESTDVLQVQRLDVVDGQQRLTTLSLLLAAIYQALREKSEVLDEDQKADLVNLKRKLVLAGRNEQIRVVPQVVGSNQNDYRAILSQIGVIGRFNEPLWAGNRRIFRTFKYFQERLQKLSTGQRDPHLPILAMLHKVNNAVLVKIEVASHSEAFTLFESLNDRGVPLTPVDLIRNKLLARLEEKEGGRVDHYFDQWNKLLGYLGDDYSVQERFFRHYYNASKDRLNAQFRKPDEKRRDPLGSVATRSTLIHIYEKIINQDAGRFIEEILGPGRLYSVMLTYSQGDEWQPLERAFKDLAHVQGSPAYLLTLHLMMRKAELQLDNRQLERIFRLLTRFFVRRNLTDTPATRDLTSIFMNIIAGFDGLYGDGIVNVVKERLVAVSSPDELFRKMLSGPLYQENVGVTRFVLCSIAEKAMTRENWRDLWRMENRHDVWTIEHIFPQGDAIPENWVQMIAAGDLARAKQLQQEHVHTLGNLTLSGYNSALSNKGFAEKRDRVDREGNPVGYKNGLNLNAELATAESWSVAQIQARTARLVELAMGLFPIDHG